MGDHINAQDSGSHDRKSSLPFSCEATEGLEQFLNSRPWALGSWLSTAVLSRLAKEFSPAKRSVIQKYNRAARPFWIWHRKHSRPL